MKQNLTQTTIQAATERSSRAKWNSMESILPKDAKEEEMSTPCDARLVVKIGLAEETKETRRVTFPKTYIRLHEEEWIGNEDR